MGGVIAWHNSECVQGLTLSCMSPWTRSFLDERGIETAIGIIKKSPYSGSEAVNLLQEAAKWSISSAAGWEPKKRVFLVAVEQIVDFHFSTGNLANDAGLLSQADGVISVYYISAAFEKTVELGGTFL